MLRLTLTFALLTVLACGGQDDTGAATDADAGGSATSAGAGGGATSAGAGDAGGSSTPVSAAAPAAATHPTVQSCLDLVKQAEFSQALPVCLKAASIDPGNAEVQAAVDKAKSEAASLDAAGDAAAAAADDALKGAMGDATGAADGANKAAADAAGKVATPDIPSGLTD